MCREAKCENDKLKTQSTNEAGRKVLEIPKSQTKNKQFKVCIMYIYNTINYK